MTSGMAGNTPSRSNAPRYSALLARPRGRGDRIALLFAAVHSDAIGWRGHIHRIKAAGSCSASGFLDLDLLPLVGPAVFHGPVLALEFAWEPYGSAMVSRSKAFARIMLLPLSHS